MIEFFSGTLGAGKTYHAVERHAEHVAKGGTVGSNVALKWDGFVRLVEHRYGVTPRREQWIDLTDCPVAEFHKLTPAGTPEMSTLVVVDEAQLGFNARAWSKTSEDLLAFLTQSRKQMTDVIFISQSAENVDKQLRRLAQFFWSFRDMSRYRVEALGVMFPTLS